ncbi:MAG: IS3 family transposase [Bacteroidota bacterium]
MENLCRPFGKYRQSWYKATAHKEREEMKQMLVIDKVKRIRKELPRLGTEKLHVCLKEFLRQHQIKMGRDKLNEVLRSANLLVPKYRRRARTTNSNHVFRKYKNLIEGMIPLSANELWVSDITYIGVGCHFAYLSLITDAYSHKIVGWNLGKSLEAKGPIAALNMALKQRKDQSKTLIHHSDRGIQYCCHAYVEILEENQAQISMTQNGDPYENAIAERVNGMLKNEIFHTQGFPNFEMAMAEVERAIKAYNTLMPHRSCDMLTPQEAHQQSGELKKRWKNYAKLKREAQEYEASSHMHADSVSTPLPHFGHITQARSRETNNTYAE